MTKKENRSGLENELRQQAEGTARKRAASLPENLDTLSPEETRKILHELQVHQIELEMQNEELRQAQAELDAVATRYFDFYDLAPVGYFTISEKGLILDANLTAATFLDVSRSDLLKQPLSRYIATEDADIFYLRHKQLVETATRQAWDTRMLKKDGTTFWARLEPIAAKDVLGSPTCRIVMGDITERKKVEGFLKDIIAKNPMSIQILDKEGLTLEVNSAYKLLFGSVPPEGYSIFNDPQLLQMGMGRLFDQLRNGEVVRFPDTYFNAHDSISEFPDVPAWIRTIGFPLNDSNEKPERFVFMHEDITERKQAEEALRASETFLETIIDNSPTSMWVSDEMGTLIRMNQACRDLFQVTDEELVGKYNILKDNIIEQQGVMPLVKRVFEKGESIHFTLQYDSAQLQSIRLGKTTQVILEVTISPVLDRQGHLIHAITQHIDITDRKQAEESLKESEKRFREMVNMLPQTFCEINLEGRLTFANKNTFTTFGYTKEEMEEGVNIAQVLIPEDHERAMVNIQKVLGGEDIGGIEYTAVTKSGSAFPVLVYSSPIIKNNQPVGIRSILINITERKEAEKALQESEGKFRDLAEKSVVGIYLVQDGVFKYANLRFAQILEYTIDEMIGKVTAEDIIFPEDWPLVKENLRKRLSGEVDSIQYEFRIRTKNHQIKNAEVYSSRTMYLGRPAVVGTLLDITDRKQAELAITSERSKLKTLSDNAPFGMVLIDKEGHFTYINTKFTELFGFDLSDIPDGRTWFKKAYPDTEYRHTVISTWREDLSDARPGERIPRVFTVNCKDGTERIVQFIPSVLVSGDYLMTCEDITELRQLENQLRQAQKMEAIGTLAGGIAHDFNNILTALMGYASLIQMKMDTSDPLRPYLDEVFSASEKAVDLTKSLLTFSRQQSVTLVPLDINNTVKGAENLLRRLLTEDIEFRISLAEDDMIVMADKSQMDQILFNLVTNARDAMPRGGTLTINTAITVIDNTFIKVHGFGEPGEYVQINISDTGMGMSEITRSKIFDPFFTTKEVGRGTGLGLATVYGIVEQSKGYITLESTLNTGTVFHIYLPQVKIRVDETENTATPPTGGKETILIAEDNEGVRRYMREVLQKYGYTVREAVDGEDAVERFKEHQDTDLIIIDSVMPKKNGREAYEEIRGIDPHVKAIFTSGYTKDIVLDKGVEEKEFDFIAKPLSLNKLLQKVREVLDK